MEFLANFKLGLLTINWAYSYSKIKFLNIEVMQTQDLFRNHLVTRLFKKLINKHLYILWLLAHSSHVKKAFIKAELI